MGVIKRQGVKQSIVNYSATAIGALSVVFIYPYSDGVYALAGFLTAAAALLAPFASLGANALTVRFFPRFKDQTSGHHGILGIILGYAALCLALFGLLAFFFESSFLDLMARAGFDRELFGGYSLQIYLLIILVVGTNILSSYASNFGRIAVPAVFNSLLYKLGLPVIVLLAIWGYLDQWAASWGVVSYHLVGVIGLLWYVYHLGELKLRPDPRFVDKPLGRSMAVFALFGILGSMGSTLTYQIDRVMVPGLIDLKQADVYNIALFIGASIELPTRTIIAVTSPIIAAAWVKGDMQQIRELYSKASINLFIIGLFLFIGIWVSLDDLFQLTGKYETLKMGQYVVFWVGITKLFDMATSVNGQVIGYSRYFYFNLVAIVVLGFSNAFLNYYFIQTLGMGILGPAVASLLSITLYNLVRVWFIWHRFRMQPFSWRNLAVMAIGGAVYWLVHLSPDFGHPLADIIKNSALVAILYLLPVYYLRLSPDFNELLETGWQRIRSIF